MFRKLVLSTFCALCFSRAQSTTSQAACTQLASAHSAFLLWPNSTDYEYERTRFWDVRSDLSPACIFLAQDESDVASLLQIATSNKAHFAIRGGGHMNYPGSNSIDDGILMTLNALNTTELAADKSSIAVGPGCKWVDVYTALAPDGLYAIGGRLKTIGVPGLSLIGGFNYLSNKYGYAMDNILSYDIILGNGTKVTADATSNPDLFWSLKGGASNFGIVTKFVLKTFAIPQISTTIQSYSEGNISQFIKAICDFTTYDDGSVAAGAVFNIQYNATTKVMYGSVLGVEEGTTSPPPRFDNFTAIPATTRIHNVTTPVQWASRLDSPNQMFRVQFAHRTMLPDAEQLIKMVARWKQAIDQLSDVEGLYPTFVFNTMAGSSHLPAKTNGIGNVWGLENETRPLVIYQTSTGWANAEDDIRMTQFSRYLIEDMHRVNQELGLAHEHIYMGDAGEWQNPWAGMPADNVQRMKDTSKKYDPDWVFQTLNYGGFKLGF